MSQTRPIGPILLWGLYLALFYFLYLVIHPFIYPILWASILTIIFMPMHRRILAWCKGRETPAASLSMAVIVVAVVIPGIMGAISILGEAIDAIQDVTSTNAFTMELMLKHPLIDQMTAKLDTLFKIQGTDIRPIFAQKARETAMSAITMAEKMLVELPSTFVSFFITLFTTFFMLRDGHSFGRLVRNLLPMSAEEIEYYAATLKKVIYVTFIGVLLTAVVQGVVAFVGFSLIGVGSALLLGLLTAVASLIPVVGSALVWLPLAIYLIATGTVLKGVLVLVLGVFFIGLVDNFVRPIFLHQYLSLHLLMTFFSLIGGIKAFGLIGIFLGPVIVSGFIGCCMLYQDYRIKAASFPEAGDDEKGVPQAGA